MKRIVSFILLFIFSMCYGNDPLVAQVRKERQKGRRRRSLGNRRWICC